MNENVKATPSYQKANSKENVYESENHMNDIVFDEDQIIDLAAEKILEEYRPAFLELAK